MKNRRRETVDPRSGRLVLDAACGPFDGHSTPHALTLHLATSKSARVFHDQRAIGTLCVEFDPAVSQCPIRGEVCDSAGDLAVHEFEIGPEVAGSAEVGAGNQPVSRL